MKRSMVETVIGAVVLIGAAWFLVFSYRTGNTATRGGFDVYADFSSIGGLKAGDDVAVSGVKVGAVSSVDLVPDSYLARVHMNLKPGLKLPTDTSAAISSQSLLGGRYMSLQPGSEDELIKEGGRIQYTQAPQNLEELLGKFIFSMKSAKDDKQAAADAAQSAAAPPATPAVTPAAPASPAPAAPSAAPTPPAAAPVNPSAENPPQPHP